MVQTDTTCHRVSDGQGKKCVSNLDMMLQKYYQRRGWTPEGVPKGEKPAELGLK